MKIGVLSDTHGNSVGIEKALGIFKKHDLEVILHAGDMQNASDIQLFQNFTLHLVKGNVDDLGDLQYHADLFGQPRPEIRKILNFGSKKIFLCHGNETYILRMALSEKYEYLIHGHSHITEDTRQSQTRVLNPGALYRTHQKSIAILDTEKDLWKVINI